MIAGPAVLAPAEWRPATAARLSADAGVPVLLAAA